MRPTPYFSSTSPCGNHPTHSAPPKTALMARSVRGLEWVVAAEVQGRLGASISSISHRTVHFYLSTLNRRLAALRTADDVFLTCGEIEGLDHTRSSLRLLPDKIQRLDLGAALAALARFRPIQHPGRFAVAASFLGRRNYNRFEVEEIVGRILERRLGMSQEPPPRRSAADIAWRIHLYESKAYVGLRLMPKPLHRRSYRSGPYTGSLHPPVAASMALLAGLYQGLVCLDPFAGSGTIGIETTYLEDSLLFLMSDIDRRAPSSAQEAGLQIPYLNGDAGQLPFAYRSVDRLVSNMPWGRHVELRGALRLGPSSFWRETRRVIHGESRVVLLSPSPGLPTDQLRSNGLRLVLGCPIRLRGRPAFVSILTPESHSHPTAIDEFGLLGKELQNQWNQYAGGDRLIAAL